jgi:nucleotidyltransferase/DNA polymerase involved in DNA repair
VTAVIVHLDADAFFASVEQAADVRLRGKPVAVGGSKRGVVASASYEARRLGIFTVMPTAKARKLCPNLITVSGDFERYEKFSRFMFSYAYDHTPVVEVASIDEGYFDLKGNRKHSAREVARAHSNRHPAEPENLRLRRQRPKQTGQRRGQQTKETILLHRDPGWPRARVPVSSGK